MKAERLTLIAALLFAVLSAVSLASLLRVRRELRALEARHNALREEAAALARKPAPPPPVDPALTREARLQLENEIRELRRLLQERDRQLAALQAASAMPPPPAAGEEVARDDLRRRRWEERVAQFREQNPERAAEIEALRINFREQVKTAVNDQVAFLEEVDITGWSPEDQESHRKLIALIRDLSDAFLGETPPNFADAEIRQTLFGQLREAGELLEQERTLLLRDTARRMGYDEDGAREFVEYIETINRVTSPRGFFPRMGGPGGRRPEAALVPR